MMDREHGQVYDHNSVSTGIAEIGAFTSAAVPQAMTGGLKRVPAWELSLTATAVKSVQRRAGTAQTGVVSGWTWVAIENRVRR